MEKKILLFQIYNSIVLTVIAVFLVLFYLLLSKPINIIDEIWEKSGIAEKFEEYIESNNEGAESKERTYNRSSSKLANRDAVISDLTNLAAMAQQHYRKPKALGGGGNEFIGWAIPNVLRSTGNGKYQLVSITSQRIIFSGSGNQTGNNGYSPVKVTMEVAPNSISRTYVNN